MLSATADASLGRSDSYPHYQLFRRAQRLGLKIMRHVPYSIESVLDSDSLVYRVELSRLVVPQKQNTQPAGFVLIPSPFWRLTNSNRASHTARPSSNKVHLSP